MIALILMSLVFSVNNDPTIIEIGGPRKVIVSIGEQKDEFEIKASFIPIKVFDAAMNKRLSRVKADNYAMHGLARYLSKDKSVSFQLSGKEVIKSEIMDDRFVYIVTIPRNAIHLNHEKSKSLDRPVNKQAKVPKPVKSENPEKPRKELSKQIEHDKERPVPELKSEIASSIMITYKAKEDYVQTISEIDRMFQEELPSADAPLLAFQKRLDATETLGLKRLETLLKEIQTDRWLLFTERDELVQVIAVQEKNFLESIDQKLQLRHDRETTDQ